MAGPAGANGKTILSGTSNPATNTGAIGDFYINTANKQIFGPKTNSGWGTGTSIVGPKGATGSQGPAGVINATNGLTYTPATQTVALPTGNTGQVLKWNGSAWAPGTDNNTNTTYSGSTSITLSGTTFQRAALTGDVTAAANNNATTVARIQGRNVANTAPANGQVLKWNGTAWAPAADNNTNTTYSGSTSITLSGTTFQRAALTGDVTAAANNNATTVARIQGRNVANTAPANGQVLKWNGTAWAPAADDNTNTNIYNTNGTLTSARTVHIGANNLMFTGTGNIGVGIGNPTAKLDVGGNMRVRTLPAGAATDQIVTADASGNLRRQSLANIKRSNIRTVQASTTLEANDDGGYVYVNSTSALTVTVPSSLPEGFSCVVVQKGTGQVTIAGNGVTLQTARGTKTRTIYSAIGVIKDTASTASVTGDAVN
ncbi:hypothetical protein PG614_02225 [Riemerella anatipestifer]|nr:hypothetical protein [Riemerella anatipestifer]MDY3534757.1 hypothetical protein [Riemerella anatipestifer]